MSSPYDTNYASQQAQARESSGAKRIAELEAANAQLEAQLAAEKGMRSQRDEWNVELTALREEVGSLEFQLSGARTVFGWIRDDPTGAKFNAQQWLVEDAARQAAESEG